MTIDATLPLDTDPIIDWPGYIRDIATQLNSLIAIVGGDFSRTVTAKNVSSVLTISDLNQIVTVSSAAAVTHILPEVTSDHKGMWVRFQKLNTGDLTITPGGSDTVANGTSGQAIINSETAESRAAYLDLEVVEGGRWAINGMFGTWSFV